MLTIFSSCLFLWDNNLTSSAWYFVYFRIRNIMFNKTNASGKKRDMGDLAIARSSTVEKIINKASSNATRCVEIATGAPLTEKEENATKKSEINPECTSIANPNYVPY